MNVHRWFPTACVVVALLALQIPAYGHPGGTDANGGHYDRKTGEYHYHNAGRSSVPEKASRNQAVPVQSQSQYQPEQSKPAPAPSTVSDGSVYVTKTGTKYHAANCRYLKSSEIPMGLKDAIDRGYGPCSVCKPPVLDTQTVPPAIPQAVPAAPKTQAAPQQPISQQAPAAQPQSQTTSEQVYITNTGKKYHRAGCRYLKSQIPISKADAQARGYGACSACSP